MKFKDFLKRSKDQNNDFQGVFLYISTTKSKLFPKQIYC